MVMTRHRWQQCHQRIEQRRLVRTGAARDQHVTPLRSKVAVSSITTRGSEPLAVHGLELGRPEP